MHYFKNIFIISIILTSLINLTGCGGSTGGLTKPVRSPHTKNMNTYSEEEQIIIVSAHYVKFKDIKNPSKKVQLAAVKSNGRIHFFSEEV